MTSLEKIHNVGTFVQITELHDMGDQMRMIIQGHRRLTSGSCDQSHDLHYISRGDHVIDSLQDKNNGSSGGGGGGE